MKFFVQLGKSISKKTGAPVHQCDTASALLLSLYQSQSSLRPEYNHGRGPGLGLINPADRVYFGWVSGGAPMPFALRTSSVLKGLLEGIFTHGMIRSRFKCEGIYDYREAVAAKNPEALKVAETEAERLAAKIPEIIEQYRLDKIFLTNVPAFTVQRVQKLAGNTEAAAWQSENGDIALVITSTPAGKSVAEITGRGLPRGLKSQLGLTVETSPGVYRFQGNGAAADVLLQSR